MESQIQDLNQKIGLLSIENSNMSSLIENFESKQKQMSAKIQEFESQITELTIRKKKEIDEKNNEIHQITSDFEKEKTKLQAEIEKNCLEDLNGKVEELIEEMDILRDRLTESEKNRKIMQEQLINSNSILDKRSLELGQDKETFIQVINFSIKF